MDLEGGERIVQVTAEDGGHRDVGASCEGFPRMPVLIPANPPTAQLADFQISYYDPPGSVPGAVMTTDSHQGGIMTMMSNGLKATLAESAPTEVEFENKLHSEILSLWITHQVGKAVARKSNDELRTLRLELGSKLYELKSILARTGRGGGWAPYLRANGLPRASADRLVDRYEASLEPETKCLTEAIAETTDAEVRRLVHSLLPRLRKVLKTSAWMEWFLVEVQYQWESADESSTAGRVGEVGTIANGDCGKPNETELAPRSVAA
jgi:hypothetical protein